MTLEPGTEAVAGTTVTLVPLGLHDYGFRRHLPVHGHSAGRTAREVVSRFLKELERQGTLQLERGRIELRNLDSLRRLAAER